MPSMNACGNKNTTLTANKIEWQPHISSDEAPHKWRAKFNDLGDLLSARTDDIVDV